MRRLVVILMATALLAACDQSSGPAQTAPPTAPPATEPALTTTTTTELEGCDNDLVDDARRLIQDQLDLLAGMSVADVAAGAADTPEHRERETAQAGALAADGCRPGVLLALIRQDADDFDVEGAVAERYLRLVLSPPGGAPDEP